MRLPREKTKNYTSLSFNARIVKPFKLLLPSFLLSLASTVLAANTTPYEHRGYEPFETSTSFSRDCARLRQLGYLPLQESAEGLVFDFSVPRELEDIAHRYSWNAQNPFFRGALIEFAVVNGVYRPADATSTTIRQALQSTLASRDALADPYPWEWVLVNKNAHNRRKETLRIWLQPHPRTGLQLLQSQGWSSASEQKLGFVFKTDVNTGVLGATPNGTYPVWYRVPRTSMKGKFPRPVSHAYYVQHLQDTLSDGSPMVGTFKKHAVQWVPYDDTGILWVSYFHGGDAIHYFARKTYGHPQSAGCVEAPLQAAKAAYKLLHYGVPVSVVSNVSPADLLPANGLAPTKPQSDLPSYSISVSSKS